MLEISVKIVLIAQNCTYNQGKLQKIVRKNDFYNR